MWVNLGHFSPPAVDARCNIYIPEQREDEHREARSVLDACNIHTHT